MSDMPMRKRPPFLSDELSASAQFIIRHGEPAAAYFARRDLLGETVGPLEETVWSLPPARRLLRGQQADGGFAAPTGGWCLSSPDGPGDRSRYSWALPSGRGIRRVDAARGNPI